VKRPDLRATRRRLRRFARRTGSVGYRSIVVPLLSRAETEHAIDLACRLAEDRRARIVFVAPLIVPLQLPFNAHFTAEEGALRKQLEQAEAVAASYGVGSKRQLIRAREGGLGTELAEVATDHRAELIVIGAPVESRRGFRKPFPAETLAILREAPCRAMIVTGPVAAARGVHLFDLPANHADSVRD
jgi:nucleotide-binding universal stress UspA family protein